MSYYIDEYGIKRNCFEITKNGNKLQFISNMDFSEDDHIINK